jgi:hypothetical protein
MLGQLQTELYRFAVLESPEAFALLRIVENTFCESPLLALSVQVKIRHSRQATIFTKLDGMLNLLARVIDDVSMQVFRHCLMIAVHAKFEHYGGVSATQPIKP